MHSCPNKLMPEGSLHPPAPRTEAFLLHQTIPGGMEAPFTTSLALNKGREVMANLLPCCHVAHHVLSQSPKEFRPPQHPKEHQGVGATTFSHVSSSCTAGHQPDRMGRIKHRKGRSLHRTPRGWVTALDKDPSASGSTTCWLFIQQEKRSRLVAIGSAGETGIPAALLQGYQGVHKPLAPSPSLPTSWSTGCDPWPSMPGM